MRSILRYTLPLFIFLFGGLFLLHWMFGRPAPLPEVFQEALPMAQAMERASESGQPVLVFASADWCRPCQVMKRGALRDERVVAAMRERTIPVYFDVTKTHDQSVIAAAEELGISSLPALILIRDGAEIARLEGDRPAVELLSWLSNL